MEYRQGQCSSCGAEYKIPASFQHDAAKCKECGGVVHIGPVTSGTSGTSRPSGTSGTPAAAKAEPSAPSTPIPARQFAGKRRDEPARPAEKPAEKQRGTLERLKAERAAASGPERTKAARAGAADRLSAAKPPASKTPVGAAAAPGGKAAGITTGAGRPSGASRRSGARRRRGGDDDGEDGGGRGARGRHGAARREKKPSMALFAIAAVLLIAGAAGAWFMLGQDGDKAAQAKEPGAESAQGGADASTESPGDEGDEGADPTVADESTGVADADAQAPADEGAADAAPAEAPPKQAPKGDPSAVDLGAYPDFGAPPGTTPAEWAEMEESVQLFLADEGARSMRALRSLEEAGAKAVPAILNGMKTLDFGDELGEKMGYALQKALTNIAHGSNYGWYEGTDDTPHYQNKRVVEFWIKEWVKAEQSIEAWIKFAKVEERAPEEAALLRETFVAEGAAVIDDDDLDLDVD